MSRANEEHTRVMEVLSRTVGYVLSSMKPEERLAIACELLPPAFAVVPVEPTEAMLRAAHAALYQWRELQCDPQANPTNPQKHAIRYRAMLAATVELGA